MNFKFWLRTAQRGSAALKLFSAPISAPFEEVATSKQL
jgi:hypothetical protein